MPPPPPTTTVGKNKVTKAWDTKSQNARNSHLGVRRFLKSQLHLLIFTLLHSFFSLYVKTRQTWNKVCYRVSSIISYHHRTPELIENDVRGLRQKPEHLSAVLNMHEDARATELERLVNEAADIAVWTACAGIPMLSIYERSGTWPPHLPLPSPRLDTFPSPGCPLVPRLRHIFTRRAFLVLTEECPAFRYT